MVTLDADPAWKLQDVLTALPEQFLTTDCRVRVFLNVAELNGSSTLTDIGASEGAVLTIVRSRSRVLTCSGRKATIWCAVSGDSLQAFTCDQARVVSAVFSPDGKQVLAALGDHSAKIWSVVSGECLQTLEGHEDAVCCGAFSPDGDKVLTASADRSARIWSAVTGECVRTLVGHRARVNSAVYSPAGGHVLTSSADHSAKIWCAASGECVRTLAGHGG